MSDVTNQIGGTPLDTGADQRQEPPSDTGGGVVPPVTKRNASPRVPGQFVVDAAVALVLFAVLSRFAVMLFGNPGSWATPVGLLLVGFAAFYCWQARCSYRDWHAVPTKFLTKRLVPAVVGLALVFAGSAVLAWASSKDSRWLTSISVSLIVGGLLPIADIIGTRAAAIVQQTDGSSVQEHLNRWLAAGLNGVTVIVTLVPFMWILGVPWWGLAVIAAACGCNTAIGRAVPDRGGWLPAAGAVVVVSGLALLRFGPATLQMAAVAVVLFWVGLRVVSVWTTKHLERRPNVLPVKELGLPRASSLQLKLPHLATKAATQSFGLVGLTGVIVTVIAWSRLRADVAGASVSTVILIAAALLGLGAVFVTRGEGFAVVAVLALVAIWVIADRDGNAPTWSTSKDAQRIVVLGDSYSSGEGGARFLADTNVEGANNCRRSPSAYGFRVAEHFHQRLTFFACSGADAVQIQTRGQTTPTYAPATISTEPEDKDVRFRQNAAAGGLAGGRPQLDNLSTETATTDVGLVVLSIGGNDALFAKIGKACALPGTCKIEDIIDQNLAEVQGAVTTALVAVAKKFPNSTVAFLAYPAVLGSDNSTADGAAITGAIDGGPTVDITGDCPKVYDQPPNAPLDSTEVCMLRTFLHNLDRTLGQAANAANLQLATSSRPTPIEWIGETENAFELEPTRAGAAPRPLPVNMIRLVPTAGDTVFKRLFPGSWIHDSFHPTDEGQRRIACVIERHLTAMKKLPFTTDIAEDQDCTSVGVAAAPTPDQRATNSSHTATATAATPRYSDIVDRRGIATAVTTVRDIVWLEGFSIILLGWVAALGLLYRRKPDRELCADSLR